MSSFLPAAGAPLTITVVVPRWGGVRRVTPGTWGGRLPLQQNIGMHSCVVDSLRFWGKEEIWCLLVSPPQSARGVE